MTEMRRIFAADGPLARAISSYRLRPQQIEMAERIAATIAADRVLIAEAGTGTGKTFATGILVKAFLDAQVDVQFLAPTTGARDVLP